MAFLDETGISQVWGKAKAKFADKADVPAATSDLTNDSGFQTADQVNAAIDAKQVQAVIFRGSVANAAALPTENQKGGDMYNLLDTGVNKVWDGSAWDDFNGSFTVDAITSAQIDAICV